MKKFYTSRGKNAISALVIVARAKGAIPLSRVADEMKISVSYLEQIFADLIKGGFVASQRGPGGGYKLARVVTSITVKQILDATDSDTEDEERIPAAFFKGVSKTMGQVFEKITLANVLNDV